jgi:hypothetical protein
MIFPGFMTITQDELRIVRIVFIIALISSSFPMSRPFFIAIRFFNFSHKLDFVLDRF